MSVALLMFNLEDHEGILRNLRSLRSAVDEIVIVDSSSPESSERLRGPVEDLDGRIVRALPMGFVDPLRPFGVEQVKSRYVFLLDADEEASAPLKSRLRSLDDREAYVVPRFEAELSSYTYHLRLFRPDAVHYAGRSFDFPEVAGTTGWLDKSHGIIHRARYRTFFHDKSRVERYLTVENVERPFTRNYLQEAMTVRLRDRSFSLARPGGHRPGSTSPVSPVLTRLAIGIEFLRDLAVGRGIRAASFGRRYARAKWKFLCELPESAREELLAIAREIDREGGLFPYLGLSEPAYVERLTAGFRWDMRGIDVYRRLLRHRHRTGRPAESVYAADAGPPSDPQPADST